MAARTEARDARMLELYEEGKSNEVIATVLASEFPTQKITARTVADRLWKQGMKSHSEGSAVTEAQQMMSESQRLVAHMMEKAADFVKEHKALPPVPERIKAIRMEDMGFDTAQEGVALFSDLHYYSKIDRRASNGLAEYNIDIARERLVRWRDGVLRFTQMNQIWVELDTLHLLCLGDDLEGHGQMFQSQALQMSESIIFQIMGFVEDMVGIILGFLERYKHLNIVKVPGNHGRTAMRAKGAYTPDNFETVAWELVAERVRNKTGGEWRTSENGNRHLEGGLVDFHIVYGAIGFLDIMGWLCAVRHGGGIKGLQATYTGAIDNKLRLNSVIGETINYYFKAHLHEAQSAEHEIRGEIIQNGSFVGPSLLSIEMSRAAANLPSQEFMLFHPTHGKTHGFRIHLADEAEIRHLEVIGRDNA
jgi:urease gamma subunit